jgi:predicted phage terminase large subunit-like protein
MATKGVGANQEHRRIENTSAKSVTTRKQVIDNLANNDASELANKSDPITWTSTKLGMELDPWQQAVLVSKSKRKALNCSRQSGKSTVAAIKALHFVLHNPGSLVILVSPSLRQSTELFHKVTTLYGKLDPKPKLVKYNETSLTLDSGSRIIALPDSEDKVRGYSNVDIIIEDEAAAVSDALYMAILPMLAVSNGEMILLSTPRGKVGHFYEAWSGQGWEKTQVPCEMVPRIVPQFLEDMKKKMGTRIFSQEFECQFIDAAGAGMFRREWFQVVNDYPHDARMVRAWDKEATPEGDFTAGVLLAEKDGRYFVVDVIRGQNTPGQNEQVIRQAAQLDGANVQIRMEEEGGSSGKDTIDRYQRIVLKGYDFKGVRSTGEKSTRANPASAAAEAGNIRIVKNWSDMEYPKWNIPAFLDELVSFPEGENDDQVDALSLAFDSLRMDMGVEMIGGIDIDL